MYRKAASSSVLSLCIQRSTALVPDVLLTDPVVRLHVVHAGTGEYVRMVHQAAVGCALEQQTQQQQQQQGVFGAAAASWDGGMSSGSVLGVMRHVVEASLQAEVRQMCVLVEWHPHKAGLSGCSLVLVVLWHVVEASLQAEVNSTHDESEPFALSLTKLLAVIPKVVQH
jgi:hypothetical protein